MSDLPDLPERISEKLEPGLPIDEVVLRLHYFNDSSDRSQRGLAFFLCDMDGRAVQQACGSRNLSSSPNNTWSWRPAAPAS